MASDVRQASNRDQGIPLATVIDLDLLLLEEANWQIGPLSHGHLTITIVCLISVNMPMVTQTDASRDQSQWIVALFPCLHAMFHQMCRSFAPLWDLAISFALFILFACFHLNHPYDDVLIYADLPNVHLFMICALSVYSLSTLWCVCFGVWHATHPWCHSTNSSSPFSYYLYKVIFYRTKRVCYRYVR